MTARLFSLPAFRAARSIGSKSPLQSAEKIEQQVQENRSAAGERVEIRSVEDVIELTVRNNPRVML